MRLFKANKIFIYSKYANIVNEFEYFIGREEQIIFKSYVLNN